MTETFAQFNTKLIQQRKNLPLKIFTECLAVNIYMKS